MKTTAIIPAAGTGTRLGTNIPKQFIELQGIPIIIRTIKLFDEISQVENIVIPIHKDWTDFAKELFDKHQCHKVREITPGGAERQESITNSLKSNFVIDSELILIHDAVRPFATPELITSLLQIAEDEGAVIPVIEPKDTIKEVKKNGVVAKTLDRNQIRCVQTPQIYWKNIIFDAFEKATTNKIIGTDSSALVEAAGYTVATAPGLETNFKITSTIDLQLATLLLQN